MKPLFRFAFGGQTITTFAGFFSFRPFGPVSFPADALVFLAALALSGPAQAQPWSGNALNFDGVNDQVVIPGFGVTAPTTEITIEFWQKVSAAAQQCTFCKIGRASCRERV